MEEYRLTKICFFLLLFLPLYSFAGTTGKITGLVIDKSTGEVLPLVNIIIVEQNIGATTDDDGNFTILNVSPGTYTLKASMIGYSDAVVLGVVVRVDLTSKVDFFL